MPNKYYGKLGGVIRDELLAGADGIPLALRNIKVAPGAEIKRGMILSAWTTDGEYNLANLGDMDRILVIARDDFVADSENFVTTAYTSGKFNRNKLILDDGVELDAFIEPLRKVNIHVAEIQERFGKYKWIGEGGE